MFGSYLIHFSKEIRGTKHYFGLSHNLPKTIGQQLTGTGSLICKEAFQNKNYMSVVVHDGVDMTQHMSEFDIDIFCPWCTQEAINTITP